MDTIEERLPPHSVEAEEAVLGSLLIDPDAIYEVSGSLLPTHFYRARNRFIYEAMLDLQKAKTPLDVVTLLEQLRRNETLQHLGDSQGYNGESVVISLLNAVPTSINLNAYAGIVADAAKRRELIAAAGTVAKLAYDETSELNDVRHHALSAIRDALADQSNDGTLSAGEAFAAAEERQERLRAGEKVKVIPTGLAAVDEIHGGGYQTGFYLVAARPGMGKTSYITTTLAHQLRLGHRILHFALETTTEATVDKLLAAALNVPYNTVNKGLLNEEQYALYKQLVAKWKAYPWFINDTHNMPLYALLNHARLMQATEGIELIYVDHIGKITLPDRRAWQNETARMTEISRELEALAHDLDIPLVAAAQLNRGVESRQDKRPQLSDLRDSGSLEADAGTVQFIYRDDYYNPHTDRPCIAELLTPKNRYGPTGTVQLYFNNTLAKFGNLAVKEIAL